MTEIPANCVLNKSITGCGATTLAILQPGHTIIAVPFVSLIQNKVAQHKDVLLGIYGEGDKTAIIKDYVDCHPSVKIMTTFDSLPKVCGILTELKHDPYTTFHVVIDEWHTLFQSYQFRNNAVRNLLEETKKMKRVTFVSATPIEPEYWLEEIKHLPEIKIE